MTDILKTISETAPNHFTGSADRPAAGQCTPTVFNGQLRISTGRENAKTPGNFAQAIGSAGIPLKYEKPRRICDPAEPLSIQNPAD